jgi:hypothetical protein
MKFPDIELIITPFHPYWKKHTSTGSLADFTSWRLTAINDNEVENRLRKQYIERLNWYRMPWLHGDKEPFKKDPLEVEEFYLFLYVQALLDKKNELPWLHDMLKEVEDIIDSTHQTRTQAYSQNPVNQ